MTTKQLLNALDCELSDANFFSIALYVMGNGLIEQISESINDYVFSMNKKELKEFKELVQSYLDNQNLIDGGNN